MPENGMSAVLFLMRSDCFSLFLGKYEAESFLIPIFA